MITIVDYGAGNISSIQNMLKKIGQPSIVGSDLSTIQKADKFILPGVGSFDTCAQKLRDSGLQDVLYKKVMVDHAPVLGICVGMQLMTKGSEEGLLPGLGWLDGQTVKFNRPMLAADFKIPHMGWAEVEKHKASRLTFGLQEESRFYFVHSYYVIPANKEDTLLFATHGHRFAAAIERENIVGVQFHPEKSHQYGMKLLENFAKNY